MGSLQWYEKEFVDFPPNYKRTEDLSDIDSVASSVHSMPPSSWWSEAQRCRQFPRCALCESHHTVGTEKRKNKHTWSTSRVRTENLGWKFIRHLLIKSTETTNHNFYSRISGLPEFWLNAALSLPVQSRQEACSKTAATKLHSLVFLPQVSRRKLQPEQTFSWDLPGVSYSQPCPKLPQCCP